MNNNLYFGVTLENIRKTYWNGKKVLACRRPQGPLFSLHLSTFMDDPLVTFMAWDKSIHRL